jgi:hypothetical protein
VTSWPSNNKEEIENMARIVDELDAIFLPYLRKRWNEDRIYKFTSRDLVAEAGSRFKKQDIQNWLVRAKKVGDVTMLDELVRDGTSAKYHALTDILDEVTSPSEKEVNVAKTVAVPQQTTTPPKPANPFDSLKSELEAINTRLSGLAQGYANVENHIRENFMSAEDQRLLLSSIEKRFAYEIDMLRRDLPEESSSLSETELGIKKYMSDCYNGLLKEIAAIPSVANGSDDFKKGVETGIKLAIEMGLRLSE